MTPKTEHEHRAIMLLGLVFAGVLMLVGSAFFLRDSLRLLRHGEHGNGSVIRIDVVHTGYRHRQREEVAVVRVYGATASGECHIPAHGVAVGQNFPMLFLPEDPSLCRRDTFIAVLGMPGLAFGLASVLLLGSLIAWDRERRKARRS